MRWGTIGAAAMLTAGCSALDSGGFHVDSMRGDTVVISETFEPFRPTKAFEAADAYCRTRGETAELRDSRQRIADRRAFIYDCIRETARRRR